MDINDSLSDLQFGFRRGRSTCDTLRCVIEQAERAAWGPACSRYLCAVVALDVRNAFNSAPWLLIDAALQKRRFPGYLVHLLRSYMGNQILLVDGGDGDLTRMKVSCGVPQGSVIGPGLWNIFYDDLLRLEIHEVAKLVGFADDIKLIITAPNANLENIGNAALRSIDSWMKENDKNPQIASSNLQIHLNLMSEWYIKWRIKPNPSKSVHTTFTLCHSLCPNVSLQNVPIPTSNTVRYLGLNLDKRLTWNAHIRIKRLALNARLRRLGPLLSNNKQSKLKVKVLMYKTLLKPMWTYGLQLWGTAKVSNTNKIQQFQNIAFRKITNAPPFVSNYTLYKDLAMKTVKEEAVDFYKRFHNRLQTHQNPLIKSLYTHTIPGNPRRRLKRNWCRDLL
ncbi:hypothetical protein QTP88_015840 [Uroleucon formosanum]